MSLFIRLLLSTLAILASGLEAIGQDRGGPPPPNRTIDPPVGLVVPIDESLVYLLLAGVILGIYYYLHSKKSQSS